MAEDPTYILLVSGDALERTAVAEYLRGCGYHVIEAIDGTEAATALQHKPVDILVSDTQLRHHGSGRSLSAWAKRAQPDIKVILVCSAEQAVECATELCEEGPAEILPYHPDKLMERIQQLRRG